MKKSTLNLAPAPEADPAPTPAPVAPPTVTHGKFTFAIRLDVAVPADVPRMAPAHALPFRDWFTKAAPFAKDGVSPNAFFPTSFWIEDRGVDAEKATAAYQKAKIREQFNQWRKLDETNRNKFDLTTIYRPGDTNDNPEPGVEVWLVLRAE